jgi:hypothetical protein
MNRGLSFSQRMKAGATPAELRKHYCMTESEYSRTMTCLAEISARHGGKL